MNLTDTPNPNAKKLVYLHDHEIGKNLEKDALDKNAIEFKILCINGVEAIFSGPGFLTVIKSSESNWDTINKEFISIFDTL